MRNYRKDIAALVCKCGCTEHEAKAAIALIAAEHVLVTIPNDLLKGFVNNHFGRN